MNSRRCMLAMALALSLNGHAAMTLRLAQPFGEHMVLQRDTPIVLRGWSAPGATVSAALAENRTSAKAGKDGAFSLTLNALPAGGPYALELKAGDEVLSLNDVLVGEVWIASGQSNMEWTMQQTTKDDIATATHPRLRLFNVARKLPVQRGPEIEGKWEVSSPETVGGFSAVAYHFGVELQKHLDVPVGLISAPWSGTPGEAWAPLEAMKADPGLKPALKRWNGRPQAERQMYEKGWKFQMELKDLRLIPSDAAARPVLVSNGGKAGGAAWPVSPRSTAATGSQTSFAAGRYEGLLTPGGWSSGHLRFDGVRDLSGITAVEFSARGNSKFEFALAQSSIRDGDTYCAPVFETGEKWKPYRFVFKDLKQQGWGQRQRLTLDQVEGLEFRLRAPNQFPDQPGVLFDAMIRPLAGFAAKGVIWYQGESNVGRHAEYGLILKALVQGWRKALDLPQLAFMVAQLPEFGQAQDEPGESDWGAFRAAQERVLDMEGTGLAVTLGLGDPADIHPKNKKPVGQRLAWEALGKTYGKGGLHGRGPRFESMQVDDEAVTLHFEKSAKGLRSKGGKVLRGFSLGDGHGEWLKVEANVVNKETVRVRIPDGIDATMLRYAWADVPEGDLQCGDGLPVGTFEIYLVR